MHKEFRKFLEIMYKYDIIGTYTDCERDEIYL